MKENDEIIEIAYQYDRVRYYKTRNPELYKELEKKEPIKVRIVKIELENGTKEILATNLGKEFTSEDIKEIYRLRWGIETMYHTVKESLKICAIKSSKKTIIEQEILSQMLVYNIGDVLESEEEKNKDIKIEILKENMIYIAMEEDTKKEMKCQRNWKK